MTDVTVRQARKALPASKNVNVSVRKIHGFTGITFDQRKSQKLGISTGNTYVAEASSNGDILLRKIDPHHAKAMEIARRGMRIYYDTLAELAK